MGIMISMTEVGLEASGGCFPHLKLRQQAQHRTKPHTAERGQYSKDRLSAKFWKINTRREYSVVRNISSTKVRT